MPGWPMKMVVSKITDILLTWKMKDASTEWPKFHQSFVTLACQMTDKIRQSLTVTRFR